MRKIRLVYFIAMAVLLGLYGNLYAMPQFGNNCSTCHSDIPDQEPIPDPVNSAPVANAGPDLTADEGNFVILNGANSSDPDNNIVLYYWEQVGGPAVTLSDSNAIQPTFTAPAVDLNGIALTFRLTVTDDEAVTDTDTVIVNVSWVNEAPTADAGANQTVGEGTIVTLDGSNSNDPDDGIASYSWKQIGQSSVTLSDMNSATPTFTAPIVDLSSISLTFELTITDNGGLKSTDTIVINVTWINEAPTADAGTDQTVAQGDLVTLDASNSSDPDDGIVSYLWSQTGPVSGDSVTFSDPTAVNPTFEAPETGTEGISLTFQVLVTDNGGLQSTDTCIINVTTQDVPPTNQPPVADAGENQTVDQGDFVTLDALGSSDPDDGIASYLWSQTGSISGITVTLSDATSIQPSFLAPEIGTDDTSLTFQVIVTDNSGLQSTDTCIININGIDNIPVNQPPVAHAGLGQTVEANDLVTLDGSSSYDPDGAIASFMWKQISGIDVTLSNPASEMPTFNAPIVDSEGASLTFQITVTDFDGLQSTDSSVVVVNAIEVPPPVNDDNEDDDDRYDDDDDDRDKDKKTRKLRKRLKKKYKKYMEYKKYEDFNDRKDYKNYKKYKKFKKYEREYRKLLKELDKK